MSEHDRPGTANVHCVRCGAALYCGMAAGADACWCAALPRLLKVPEDSQTGCLCESCLRAELQRQSSEAGESHPE